MKNIWGKYPCFFVFKNVEGLTFNAKYQMAELVGREAEVWILKSKVN